MKFPTFIFTYKNGNGTEFSYGDEEMTVVYLKPCGLNMPHIHPRASTISYVAAFNNEDPGTAQLTEAMKAIPLDILTATLNTSASSDDIDRIRQNFPKTAALGIEACYKACNIPRKA